MELYRKCFRRGRERDGETIRTKRSDAGWQEDAASNNEVRLSNSSKAGVVKCEVGARVTSMDIIVFFLKIIFLFMCAER